MEEINSKEPTSCLVALSGGVDSSVAAALALEQGLQIEGAYMKNWINEENIVGDCPWQQDIEDARAVADTLGIPFRVVNLMKEYRERIVDYLLAGYQSGITPNPDVMCNREIKFGAFLNYAKDHGFHSVATGHYAQCIQNDDGTMDIYEGADPNKDQTYFLALMHQHQAKAARFPIGHLPKPEVRNLAKRFGLPTAQKKDSQGICFIGQIKMVDFLKAFVPESPGDIVNLQGEKLGTHRGLHYYTLGQRKGIGVASNAYKKNYVVVSKNPDQNQLVVAFDQPNTPFLYAKKASLSSISWVNRPPEKSEILARPRYRAPAQPATLELHNNQQATIFFKHPQRALTPGQVCALYDGKKLLGGALFSTIHYAEEQYP